MRKCHRQGRKQSTSNTFRELEITPAILSQYHHFTREKTLVEGRYYYGDGMEKSSGIILCDYII